MIDVYEYINLTKAERQKHINLELLCIERGGNSTNHKGVLAEFLNTSIPNKKVLLAHACNNGRCSNPLHLYWATYKENIVEDGTSFNTWKNAFQRCVDKHGYDNAINICRNNLNHSAGGKGNKGKPKSEDHKKKIAETLRNKKLNATVTELV